ncbi:nitroreductase family protein [Planctomicrobium sp. SH668]|uniref:nitroreductase family protein n=1 Tax=Planctomicrobium sp. SH668 TaxID=3448126 RepID=UPI003F5BBE9A
MSNLPNPLAYRTADHEVSDLFLKRWSPRAFTGKPIPQSVVNSLLEAARWAPSSNNEQEWRFLYAHRDTEFWQTYFDLLMPGNQTWCANAGVLVVVVSKTKFDRNDKPNRSHSLDTGMAVQNLLLQASLRGDVAAHAMAGFDPEAAIEKLGIPEGHHVECMIALGHPGDPAQLPAAMREREIPSGRKKISQFAAEGKFQF